MFIHLLFQYAIQLKVAVRKKKEVLFKFKNRETPKATRTKGTLKKLKCVNQNVYC